MKRRTLFSSTVASILLAALGGMQALHAAQPVPIEVWKDASCGCCQAWVAHLEKNGFKATVYDTGNTSARASLGMPAALGSCHTARVAGYVVEGHVPATDIQRLLREKPQARGLSVPGMPVGSPGMDGPEYKGRQDAYDVLLVSQNGSASVYQSHPGQGASTPAPALSPWSQAEVRRIDLNTKKITLKHGFIATLGMDPMTMVFQMRDAGVLQAAQSLKPGDAVEFVATYDKGAYLVTQIKPATAKPAQ